MKEGPWVTYYTDQEVDNLWSALFMFIVMQTEYAIRIINLFQDTIQKLDDAIDALIFIQENLIN
jgi:hypothetical protein